MKAMMKRALSAAAACCCIPAMCSAFSAQAVDNQPLPDEKHTVDIETVCPGFVPTSKDEIQFFGLYYNDAHIKIVQHSPERENLVLYDADIVCAPDYVYRFAAEPGNYTISISTDTVFNSAAVSTYTQDFTIENADYAVNPSYFKTTVLFCGKYMKTADSAEAEPSLLMSDSYYAIEVKNPINVIGFPRYSRVRGDFNGDGKAELTDAQLTLNHYVKVLAGNPASVEPGVAAACDITGDGVLDPADAQQILMFYTANMAGNRPVWQDGTTDAAHDEKYTDYTAVFPGEAYEVHLRAVPYFKDAVPENAEKRKSDADRARTHFTKPITVDTEFVGGGVFLGADEGTKKLSFSFKELGETQQFTIKNTNASFPGFAKTGEMLRFDVTDAADNNNKISTTISCDTCSGDTLPHVQYYKGCYIEYNVNTGEFKAYPFNEAGNPLFLMSDNDF